MYGLPSGLFGGKYMYFPPGHAQLCPMHRGVGAGVGTFVVGLHPVIAYAVPAEAHAVTSGVPENPWVHTAVTMKFVLRRSSSVIVYLFRSLCPPCAVIGRTQKSTFGVGAVVGQPGGGTSPSTTRVRADNFVAEAAPNAVAARIAAAACTAAVATELYSVLSAMERAVSDAP